MSPEVPQGPSGSSEAAIRTAERRNLAPARWGFSRSGVDVVTLIIALNFGVLLLQQLSPGTPDSDTFHHWLTTTFGLSRDGLFAGRFWQLITHLFVHGGSGPALSRLTHFAMNMALVYAAGKALVPEIGNLAVAVLYFVSGVAGGLLQIILLPESLLVGASGAAFGLVLAYTTLFPAENLQAWLLVFPVSLRSHTLGRALLTTNLAFAALSLVAKFFQFSLPFLSGIAHAAHAGGSLVGWAAARWIFLPRRFPKLTRASLMEQRALNERRLAQTGGSNPNS